jgi:hypothetical protein
MMSARVTKLIADVVVSFPMELVKIAVGYAFRPSTVSLLSVFC